MTSLSQKTIILCSLLMLLLIQPTWAALYSYEKKIDQFTTYELIQPNYSQNSDIVPYQELCTIIEADEEGNIISKPTYVWVPDETTLPEQPAQVATTLKKIFPTPPPFMADIIAASPFLQLTKKRIDKTTTQTRYSDRDEALLKSLNSLSVFPAAKFLQHIDECREWDAEKDKGF